VLWAIAHHLARAAAVLACPFHAKAMTATIRAHLINVPLGWPAARCCLHRSAQNPVRESRR
jgi:hypothetical protein